MSSDHIIIGWLGISGCQITQTANPANLGQKLDPSLCNSRLGIVVHAGRGISCENRNYGWRCCNKFGSTIMWLLFSGAQNLSADFFFTCYRCTLACNPQGCCDVENVNLTFGDKVKVGEITQSKYLMKGRSPGCAHLSVNNYLMNLPLRKWALKLLYFPCGLWRGGGKQPQTHIWWIRAVAQGWSTKGDIGIFISTASATAWAVLVWNLCSFSREISEFEIHLSKVTTSDQCTIRLHSPVVRVTP